MWRRLLCLVRGHLPEPTGLVGHLIMQQRCTRCSRIFITMGYPHHWCVITCRWEPHHEHLPWYDGYTPYTPPADDEWPEEREAPVARIHRS